MSLRRLSGIMEHDARQAAPTASMAIPFTDRSSWHP